MQAGGPFPRRASGHFFGPCRRGGRAQRGLLCCRRGAIARGPRMDGVRGTPSRPDPSASGGPVGPVLMTDAELGNIIEWDEGGGVEQEDSNSGAAQVDGTGCPSLEEEEAEEATDVGHGGDDDNDDNMEQAEGGIPGRVSGAAGRHKGGQGPSCC